MILYWVIIQLSMIILKVKAIVTWTWWIVFIPSMIIFFVQIFTLIISAFALGFVQSVHQVLEDYDDFVEKD